MGRAVKWKAWLGAALALALAQHAAAAGYDALLPLLVDLPGWEAEPAQGAETTAMGAQAVTAFRTYGSGARALQANVLVGALAGMSWLPEYTEGYRMESPKGFSEVRRIAGFLVFTMFEKDGGSGGIVVLLETGAEKPERGAVLAISFEGLNLAEALRVAQRFDWAAIKAEVAKIR